MGFFYVTGHGVSAEHLTQLEQSAIDFFAEDDDEKAGISMERGGRAWRGWFPLEGELTSGVPDRKEGIYFGEEGDPGDPRAMHGPNLFPGHPRSLRPAVLHYLDDMTALGQTLMRGIALGLGLDGDFFRRELCTDPVVLFRIFHYPVAREVSDGTWGVAEHTDYGLLTMLLQDATGGLEVRTPDGDWIDAPPIEGSFVCNIGDMLDRMTGGRYRSTPHRVRPPTDGPGRLSFPFFFDPSWDAEVGPLPLDGMPPPDDAQTRWDGSSLREISGTYGDYLTAKVAKVFPNLV